MKQARLYLQGTYPARFLSYYQGLAAGCFLVAVDGGYRFFARSGLTPDVLLGDFDSLRSIPRGLPNSVEVLRFPTDKDQTDAQLALSLCLERGFRRISLVDPSYGVADHFLGNVMLLRRAAREAPEAKLTVVNHRHEVRLLRDSKTLIRDGVGDSLSVLPLGENIRLTCLGTAYRAEAAVVPVGDSRGLRNLITARRAEVGVRGEALLIRTYSKPPGGKTST